MLPPLMELRGGRQRQQQDRDRLPVIVCPSQLEFFLDQQESHKQVLTLYNINDFALRFLLQSNAPRRYAVPEPEGLIRPHCFIDVVVRHREASEANVGRWDQLRIVIREEGGPLRGSRDVPVTLRASRKRAASTAPPAAGATPFLLLNGAHFAPAASSALEWKKCTRGLVGSLQSNLDTAEPRYKGQLSYARHVSNVTDKRPRLRGTRFLGLL